GRAGPPERRRAVARRPRDGTPASRRHSRLAPPGSLRLRRVGGTRPAGGLAGVPRRGPRRPEHLGGLAPHVRRLPAPEAAMSFEWPLALLALPAVPLLVALYVRHERRRTVFAARFGNPALLPNLVDRSPGRRRHLPLAILLVALTAMIVGVARPHATVSVRREEATVILAVDVSRSMRAKDVEPTRLDAARTTAEAFLAKVPKK